MANCKECQSSGPTSFTPEAEKEGPGNLSVQTPLEVEVPGVSPPAQDNVKNSLCQHESQSIPQSDSNGYQSLIDEHRLQMAHLKPLAFPERTVEVLSCFTHQQSDFPIQCLLCAAVFDKSSCEQENAVNSSSDKCSVQESSSSWPPEENNFSAPSTIDPQESGESDLVDKMEGICVETSSKPPTVKLTPRDEWLQHLLLEHKVVIHNVQEIVSLKCYSEYWKRRFQQAPINELTPIIRTRTGSKCEDYCLLSNGLPEEKSLRQYLHKKKLVRKYMSLEAILEVQAREREDTQFSRRCLFCSQVLTGNRRVLFQHMLDGHGFNVGQPDNLVLVNEFLDLLQEKLNSLQCLFCERTFRDRITLKDHMRKKGHKKINAQNKTYDRFYMINYLELGKTWEQVQRDDEREGVLAEEGDWHEDPSPLNDSIYCLFCVSSHPNTEATLTHMRANHGFDFNALCTELSLDYYRQVKVVNYIRRKIHVNTCVYCNLKFKALPDLLDHMSSSCHFRLPGNKDTWDQPQYLFPTYENDCLLYGLDDCD